MGLVGISSQLRFCAVEWDEGGGGAAERFFEGCAAAGRFFRGRDPAGCFFGGCTAALECLMGIAGFTAHLRRMDSTRWA